MLPREFSVQGLRHKTLGTAKCSMRFVSAFNEYDGGPRESAPLHRAQKTSGAT